MLHTTPDGGVAVSVLGPVSAKLPGGVAVNVSGQYPFEDDVTVTLSGLPGGAVAFPLYVRVPSWATAATVSVNGGAPVAVGSMNGTMLKVDLSGATGPTVSVTLSTNPSVRLVPFYNGALAVYRGALLYSLRLDENFVVTGSQPLDARVKDYVVSQPGCDLSPGQQQCTAPFNVALVVDDPAHPEQGFAFSRTGDVPYVPFAAGLWGASNLELVATVRQVAAWGVALNAAAPPPASPVDCSAPAACGPTFPATFVPYGATHLRMSELPWTARPPCGASAGYNSSGTVLRGDAMGFDTSGGASMRVPQPKSAPRPAPRTDPGPDTTSTATRTPVLQPPHSTANENDMNIRSGDPGDIGTAAWLTVVSDKAHTISGASLSFQYVAGYGGDGAPGGATLELVALEPGPCGAPGKLIQSLYSSPVLSHFPYDGCHTCYSPPTPITVSGLSLDASGGVVFALRFTNNQRNVQLKLPLNVTVSWN